MAKKSWSDYEVNFLIDNYANRTASDLAERLNRTLSSVEAKLKTLDVSKVEEPGNAPINDKPTSNKPAVDPNADAKKKLRKFFGKNHDKSLLDICNHMEMSPLQVNNLIEELRGDHYNIEVAPDGERIFLSSEPRIGGEMGIDVHEYFGSSREVVFGIMSDLHYCNIHSREKLIDFMYEKFKVEGVPIVFNPGNMIDGEAFFNKYELTRWGISGQVDYLAERAPKVEGITTYFITGDDHEGWLAKRDGLNIGRVIETAFEDHGRNDWKYLAHTEADVAFKTKDAETVVRIAHPGGGTAYAISYQPQKIVESLQGGEKPHVQIIGHYHKLGHFMVRNVHTILAGTFEDQTTFMRKKHIEAHLGGWIVRMQLGKDGSVLRFMPECYSFFDRKVYQVNRDFPVANSSVKKTEDEIIQSVKVF